MSPVLLQNYKLVKTLGSRENQIFGQTLLRTMQLRPQIGKIIKA